MSRAHKWTTHSEEIEVSRKLFATKDQLLDREFLKVILMCKDCPCENPECTAPRVPHLSDWAAALRPEYQVQLIELVQNDAGLQLCDSTSTDEALLACYLEVVMRNTLKFFQ